MHTGHPTCRHAASRRKGANTESDEGLPQASGGRKEYKDDDGKVTKVVEWFGFKLHLIVDVKNEVVLAYEFTDTKAGDGETLPAVLAQAEANLPPGPDRDAGLRRGGPERRCVSDAQPERDQAVDPDAGLVEGRSRADAARLSSEVGMRNSGILNVVIVPPCG